MTNLEQKIGLTDAQASAASKKFGKNLLIEKKKTPPIKIFAAQFKDFLTMVLLASTVATVFMGEYSEAITIGLIIFLNSTLGFIQEIKTEKTLEALKKMSAPKAKVYRNGILVERPTAELVPEDIAFVESGDRIPADGALLSSSAFSSDESMLTGESLPVKKETGDRIYAGTIVTAGNGIMKVAAIGMETEMGKIAGLMDAAEESQTPLQQRLDELGKLIAIGCLLICLCVSAAGVIRGEKILDMLMTGVSLAVAAVPEGLPAIVTVSLALAVNRMVKKRALIKKLHAVEALGCADVICSDKTGTLTENRMTVEKLWLPGEEITVTGKGYSSEGGFFIGKKAVRLTDSQGGKKLLDCCVFCQNSSIRLNHKQSFDTLGDPTEVALLICAHKAGAKAGAFARRVKEFPFDSERKMMSVVIEENSSQTLYTKGSCEAVLSRCHSIQIGDIIENITVRNKRELLAEEKRLASEGLRVLALAYRPAYRGEEREDDLIFLGLAAMIDPPRKEAKEAVSVCKRAGIKTVMITGDHAVTAMAIAKALSIYCPGDMVVSGDELEKMSDEELREKVEQISVFARVSPRHKLKIVRALKAKGHIVAMTGDGINDAPAIKEADIGVSMGLSGTDVAKEAADVILMDDNFATLKTAVEEGRAIYQNIRKFMRYLLSCNIGEVLTMFLGIFFNTPVVLLPIHILLVNLVTDGLPAIALGLEPAEANIMKRKPRKPDESVFSGGLLAAIVFRGILIGLTTLGVFTTFLNRYGLEKARTGALAALILSQLIHVFECKSEEKSLFSVSFFSNRKLILAVLVSVGVLLGIVYFPPLQKVFQTVPLQAKEAGEIGLFLAAAPILAAAVNKIGGKKRGGKKGLLYRKNFGIIK